MNRIKCPHCGEIFTIDERDYESIVRQIKDHQYKEDLADIEKRYQSDLARAVQLAKAEVQSGYSEELGKKNVSEEELGIWLRSKANMAKRMGERDNASAVCMVYR